MFEDILTVIIASMLLSFAIAFPIIHFLYKFKITRRMDVDFSTIIEARNLKYGVPIMGGLIVVITVILANLLFNPNNLDKALIIALTMFFISALLGGFDDILNIYGRERAKLRTLKRTLTLVKVHKDMYKRILIALSIPWEAYKRFFFMLGSNPGKGIQAHEKILVQSIVGLLLGFSIYFGFGFGETAQILWIPFTSIYLNIGWLIIPFAWISILLMTNAVNLADGMDGLAAGQILSSFSGFLVLAIIKNEYSIAFLIATVIGSLITYLYFNIPPARFQMGDVGSLSLGTLLATVAFMLEEPLMLLIFGLPFAITLLSTIVQGIGRRILGRRIFRMAPIHYHFQMKNNWSEEKVVMRFVLFALIVCIFGVWVYLRYKY